MFTLLMHVCDHRMSVGIKMLVCKIGIKMHNLKSFSEIKCSLEKCDPVQSKPFVKYVFTMNRCKCDRDYGPGNNSVCVCAT